MVLTGFSDVEAIIQAINKGQVYKYITKPWNTDELKITIDNALDSYDLKLQNLQLIDNLKVANTNLENKVKERTKEVVEQRDELQFLNATKDKFFSILAHDLKNPFTAILSITRSLANDFNSFDDDDKLFSIQRVNKSVNNIYELLENLLLWARSQTGRLEYQPEILDLAAITNTVTSISAMNAEKKGIRLLSEIEGGTSVYCDRNMLTSILRNLVNNAIKFTPNNGKVKVLVNGTNNGENKKGFIEISVKDTGIGISEEDINKLFRIDVSHKSIGNSKEKGTGLGLIICKEFVEHHKGSISVISKLGEGSSFNFTVPKA